MSKPSAPKNFQILNNIPIDEIWVNDFDSGSVQGFHNKLLQRVDDDPSQPVVIYIDSYGGEIYSLLAMLDIMKEVKSKSKEGFYYITVAVGKAMSCGAALLAFGDFRVAHPNATIMMHRVSSGTSGTVQEMKIDIKETERLDRELSLRLMERIGFKGTLDEYNMQMDKDLFMSPAHAKKLGFIDEIGYIERKLALAHMVEVKKKAEPKKVSKGRKKK